MDDPVPHEVQDYLVYFSRMIEEENVGEILSLYDQAFPELTERFVSHSEGVDIDLYHKWESICNERG